MVEFSSMACLARKVPQRLERFGHSLPLRKPSFRRSVEVSSCPTMNEVEITLYHRSSIMCQFTRTLSTSNRVTKDSSPSFISDGAREIICRIEGYGVSTTDILCEPEVSALPINVIENRLQYCAEGGLKTNIFTITKFQDIVKSPLKVLKSAGILSTDVNVLGNLMGCVKFDGPHPSHIDLKNLSYERIHFLTLCHCLQYSFGNTFPLWKRYYHASIKFCLQNIDTLQKITLGWRWIRDHPSLVCFANPHNLSKLHELDKVYETPVSLSFLLRRDSDVAFVDYENLRAIFFILMKNKVCVHDILSEKRSHHFLMDPDLLDLQFKRLKRSKFDPDENILSMLYKLKCIPIEKKKSIDHFEKMIAKIKNPFSPLNENVEVESWRHEMQLWMDEKNFQLEFKPCHHDPYTVSVEDSEDEFHRKGTSTTRKSTRLPAFIATSLDIPQAYVKSQLSLLPMGLSVTPSRASTTLKFLLESGFSEEEIGKNTQLLLYPRHTVQEVITQVLADPLYGAETYRSRHLQLCLYHILIRYNYRVHPV